MRPLLRSVCLLAAAGIAVSSVARAQTTDAAILGRVTDSVGAPLANVSVIAKNTATGSEWTLSTNATGRFAVVQLPLGGPYTVTAKRLGYRPATQSGYDLTLGQRIVADFRLSTVAA